MLSFEHFVITSTINPKNTFRTGCFIALSKNSQWECIKLVLLNLQLQSYNNNNKYSQPHWTKTQSIKIGTFVLQIIRELSSQCESVTI